MQFQALQLTSLTAEAGESRRTAALARQVVAGGAGRAPAPLGTAHAVVARQASYKGDTISTRAGQHRATPLDIPVSTSEPTQSERIRPPTGIREEHPHQPELCSLKAPQTLTFVTVPPSPPLFAATRSRLVVAGHAVYAVTLLLAPLAKKSRGTDCEEKQTESNSLCCCTESTAHWRTCQYCSSCTWWCELGDCIPRICN